MDARLTREMQAFVNDLKSYSQDLARIRVASNPDAEEEVQDVIEGIVYMRDELESLAYKLRRQG